MFGILLQTNIEITAETDFNRLLQIEEEQVQKMCEDIIALKPDLVFTEKGVSGRYFMNTVAFLTSLLHANRPCTALFGEA